MNEGLGELRCRRHFLVKIWTEVHGFSNEAWYAAIPCSCELYIG